MQERFFWNYVRKADLDALPFAHEFEIIFGVHYLHVVIRDKGDLYLTGFGIDRLHRVIPPRFLTDKPWFAENAVRLEGTSATYKIPIDDGSSDREFVVLKNNRMGRDIPAGHDPGLFGAEFNSPFEEFSLVMEMRDSVTKRSEVVVTQRPLAIYVPSERVELWRSGREEYLMKSKIEEHADEVPLDVFRDYVTVYEWVRGIDAAQAFKTGLISEEMMVELTLNAERRMEKIGYRVRDRKPHHIILRQRSDASLVSTSRDGVLYAVIDYELLERMPDFQQKKLRQLRLAYHKKQRDRSLGHAKASDQFRHTNVLGVDYVYVHAESTGGKLWVVGKDPELVDYFYPERWENATKNRLSMSREVFHTVTKDAVNLVCSVSRAGRLPVIDPFRTQEKKLLEFGHNTPFEEFSLAIELNRNGIRVVYPRAIYEVAGEAEVPDSHVDPRRYEKYVDCLSPDGDPAFKLEKTYITLWGFYNGSDEQLAEEDGEFLESIDSLRALQSGLISETEYLTMMDRKERRLQRVGVEDLNLHGHHLLISLTSNGKLLRSGDGHPDVRICNFEFLRRS